MASEFELIAALRRRLPATGPSVLLGPGDDAALIQPPPGQGQVLSTDTLVANRHFPADLAPALLAWRALAVNLSDLAAMGAEPGPLLIALTAPDLTPAWIDGFCDGVLACLAAHAPSATLVGGNLARGPLQVSVSVTGWVPPAQALLRSGAKVGDRIFVSGTLGAASARRLRPGACGADAIGRSRRAGPLSHARAPGGSRAHPPQRGYGVH
jgi:thiamine-monophosphate kinase